MATYMKSCLWTGGNGRNEDVALLVFGTTKAPKIKHWGVLKVAKTAYNQLGQEFGYDQLKDSRGNPCWAIVTQTTNVPNLMTALNLAPVTVNTTFDVKTLSSTSTKTVGGHSGVQHNDVVGWKLYNIAGLQSFLWTQTDGASATQGGNAPAAPVTQLAVAGDTFIRPQVTAVSLFKPNTEIVRTLDGDTLSLLDGELRKNTIYFLSEQGEADRYLGALHTMDTQLQKDLPQTRAPFFFPEVMLGDTYPCLRTLSSGVWWLGMIVRHPVFATPQRWTLFQSHAFFQEAEYGQPSSRGKEFLKTTLMELHVALTKVHQQCSWEEFEAKPLVCCFVKNLQKAAREMAILTYCAKQPDAQGQPQGPTIKNDHMVVKAAATKACEYLLAMDWCLWRIWYEVLEGAVEASKDRVFVQCLQNQLEPHDVWYQVNAYSAKIPAQQLPVLYNPFMLSALRASTKPKDGQLGTGPLSAHALHFPRECELLVPAHVRYAALSTEGDGAAKQGSTAPLPAKASAPLPVTCFLCKRRDEGKQYYQVPSDKRSHVRCLFVGAGFNPDDLEPDPITHLRLTSKKQWDATALKAEAAIHKLKV